MNLSDPNFFLHRIFIALKRSQKRLIMVAVDCVVLPVALWSSFVLSSSTLWPAQLFMQAWWLFIVIIPVGLLIFMRLGLYRAVVRYMGSQAIWTVTLGVGLLTLFLSVTIWISSLSQIPNAVPINFFLTAIIYVGGSRLVMRSYYQWLLNHCLHKQNVLIYGAGGAGVQLGRALAGSQEMTCAGFLDDDPSLWNSVINGYRVYDPKIIPSLLDEFDIRYILLAIPSATPEKRKQILDRLADYPVHVKTLPALHDIVSGEFVAALREVEVEDLLGRETVPPIKELLEVSIANKVVMVTGAGGSIGSEICLQVLQQQPKAIVLFEQSEYALYRLEQSIRQFTKKTSFTIPFYPVLGSVQDHERLNTIIQRFHVETIYHAAAFKHVPLVEQNMFEGLRNNAFGTQTLANAAIINKVERFVLVSTDKAVRPTNMMGASKRIAELVIQDLARKHSSTLFSIVRFGNVLGSSGSVVPLFKQQIAEGGPITVTHPDVTRYFMTIPEAASLVIQAGSMAKGGDVFVLDMGESVKILDLARKMIRLMGMDIRDENNPDSGIPIVYTGLRSGEKLYEELSLGGEIIPTQHPKISREIETPCDTHLLESSLIMLNSAIQENDIAKAKLSMQHLLPEYLCSSVSGDWVQKASERRTISNTV